MPDPLPDAADLHLLDRYWNVGVKTAAAQNMVAIGFIEKTLHKSVTWLEWFIAAAPFGILMTIALYFVMTTMMPPEVKEIPGGRERIRKSLADLGPMKASEISGHLWFPECKSDSSSARAEGYRAVRRSGAGRSHRARHRPKLVRQAHRRR